MPFRRPGAPRARTIVAVALAALLAALPSSPPVHGEEWKPVAPGVDYRLYSLRGPNRVYVARLSLSSPNVIVESSLASGELSQGFETVSEMARRYDGSVIAWGGNWGPRARVLVAINGSSFDAETGEPYGGMFQSGWYSLRYGNLAGGSGFVWTSGRDGLVRGCVANPKERQVVTRLSDGRAFEIVSLNQRRPNRGLILYTPQYREDTPGVDTAVEVVVRLEHPAGVMAAPRFVPGTVVEIRHGGNTPILFDHVVLSARGSEAIAFVEHLSAGDRVGISQEITDLGSDCQGDGGFNWADAYAAIGGGFVFLRDGEIEASDDAGAYTRAPRTAVCLNNEYVYFVVVDGRKDGSSRGMTFDELGTFCRDELDALWGLNQDGGGSSAMWVDGKIVNSPSDGFERWVANGLMMVAVEPAVRSNRFREGYDVTVQLPAEIRTGPGTAFPVLQTAAPGETALIARSALGLRGVFAAGSYWWKAEVNGELGFLPEQSLVSPDGALAWIQLPPPTLATADR